MSLSLAPFAERPVVVSKIAQPWPGAVIDIDFQGGLSAWWNGAFHTTSDFSSYSLGAGSIGAQGLDAASDTDIRVPITWGSFLPGSCAYAAYHQMVPPGTNVIIGIDANSNNDRISIRQNTTPNFGLLVVSGGTNQANITQVSMTALGVKHGIALSWDNLNTIASGNGVTKSSSTTGILPSVTPTFLRLGKGVGAGTHSEATLARVIVFSTTKTQTELNTYSLDMRDRS